MQTSSRPRPEYIDLRAVCLWVAVIAKDIRDLYCKKRKVEALKSCSQAARHGCRGVGTVRGIRGKPGHESHRRRNE